MFEASIFTDILKLIRREDVSKLVNRHGSDRWRKTFRTWDHLVAMLAGQFSGIDSLRDVENLFERHSGQLYHLNCSGVKRSTLGDANAKRDYRVFADLAGVLIERTGRKARAVKNLVSVLDSSPIRLKGRGLDWAGASRTRVGNQGLKLHLGLEPDAGLVTFAKLTGMTVNDITAATDMPLEENRIYLFDKGYCDYNWWSQIIEAGSHFVTRIKKNAAYKVVETRQLSCDEAENVLSDKVIMLTNKSARGGKTNKLAGRPLRLVEITHPGGKAQPFLIVSDIMDASASQIAAWYKRRWSIELMFKWIKQNLKIKRFMGESKNAIMIQIFVAIIAYMLVAMYKNLLATSHKGRLKDLIITLKTGLFQPHKTRQWPRLKPNPDQQELWDMS